MAARPRVLGLRTLVMALLLSASIGTPATGLAQTLLEALSQAYESNPALAAQRAKLRATDEDVAQALSNWRPTVTVNGNVAKNYNDSFSGDNRRQNRSPRSVDLTVTQSLYRGGRTLAETAKTKNLVFAERAELLSVEQTVLFDGATAYMDVLRDQAVLQLNINNETVLRRQLQAAQDRFQVGEITRTDVAQSESRLARATADRIQSEGDLTASRAIYNNVIGEMPGTLRPPPPLEALPANEEEAVAMARNDAPDVGVALYTEKASRDDIRLITGELLPTLDLTGTLSDIREASSSSSRSESAKLTGRLVVPLYQSGSVASKVREAKQTAARRRAELADAVRDAIEFATRAWQSLQTTRARITSFQAQIRATEIALDGVRQEAAVGERTVLDVLDAEQELLDARVSLVRAQRDEIVAGFDVKLSVGQLTAKELGLAVKIYDFERHYNAVRSKWFGLGIVQE